jgi:ABC-type branched-subunit amino acid transport system permease subunit
MSDTWGTVYQMERDKAMGYDADSLRRKNARLRAALIEVAGLLSLMQLQDISAETAQVFADLGIVNH